MVLLSGSANAPLATAVAERLHVPFGDCLVDRFPDGELRVEVREKVRGRNVYVVQPTNPPVETHLFELLLLADACRRAGAARLTAVIPYFGYARQDRRAGEREPIAARVAADVIAAGGFHAVVAVDLHNRSAEGFFPMPLAHLSAVPLLADALPRRPADEAVVVAPDLGAVKLAERYGRLLDLPVATVRKIRVTGRDVRVERLAGDVRGRRPIVVDDMLSTGATVAAAVNALLDAGAAPDITVVVTHGLFSPPADETLRALPITRIITADTVRLRADLGLPLRSVSVAPLLAEVIRRLEQDQSLEDLLSRG